MCRTLAVPASTYYAATTSPPSARQLRDERLKGEILRVYDANFQVCGARKLWRQLLREGIVVARCTAERLMRELGIAGGGPRPAAPHHGGRPGQPDAR